MLLVDGDDGKMRIMMRQWKTQTCVGMTEDKSPPCQYDNIILQPPCCLVSTPCHFSVVAIHGWFIENTPQGRQSKFDIR